MMEFRVVFKKEYNGRVVAFSQEKAGLDLVDSARTELDLPLPIHRFCETLPWESLIEIVATLTEEQARESGLFRQECQVEVTVSSEDKTPPLNKFSSIVMTAEKREDTGEILHVRWSRKIQLDKIVEAWAAAGYSEEWEVSSE